MPAAGRHSYHVPHPPYPFPPYLIPIAPTPITPYPTTPCPITPYPATPPSGHTCVPQVGQILSRVLVRGERPELPEDVQDDFPAMVALIRRCWAADPGDRPSADDVVADLEACLEACTRSA